MNLHAKIISSIFCLYLLCVCSLYAQRPLPNTEPVAKDSTTAPIASNRYSLFSLFDGKPGKAAFRGLIVPSGGQIYNRKYIKAGIILALEGTVLFFAIDRTQNFNRLQNGYLDVLNGREPDYQGITSASTLRTARDNARKDKDYLWIGFGLVHFLAIAESFVDRHLMDFDVSDDLSLRLLPPSSDSYSLGLISFQYNISGNR